MVVHLPQQIFLWLVLFKLLSEIFLCQFIGFTFSNSIHKDFVLSADLFLLVLLIFIFVTFVLRDDFVFASDDLGDVFD
jgi:hypothetical protein